MLINKELCLCGNIAERLHRFAVMIYSGKMV